VTVTHGTNRVIGVRPEAILDEVRRALADPMPHVPAPPLWDGQAAARIVDILARAITPEVSVA
jgi:UDP-N-acetylglucosamine 2-epimerase (non-hydrolysing)